MGWALHSKLSEPLDEEQDKGEESNATICGLPEAFDVPLLLEVWEDLEENYLRSSELTGEELFYGALDGLVDAAKDPYTDFFNPEEAETFHSDLAGEFEGIGAELSLDEENRVVIVSPLKGSPADEAGLLPQDLILEVDGVSTYGLSVMEVVQMVRGEANTDVVLTVVREGEEEPLEISITRALIDLPSVEYRFEDYEGHMIEIIHLYQFGEETSQEFQEAVQAYFQNGAEGMVLDLRFNGGGLVNVAIEVLSEFFEEEDKAMMIDRGEDQEKESIYLLGEGNLANVPLVVVVNEGSASASEIVAGAIQDYERAPIIGVQTFGKGTMQDLYELPDGSMVKVTTAQWLTPDGRSIQDEGITPDTIIEMDPSLAETEEDIQLENAITTLLTLL